MIFAVQLILQQQQQLAEEVARRQQEEKRKADAAKLKDEVRERTQQLLDKQLQQLKVKHFSLAFLLVGVRKLILKFTKDNFTLLLS
jgi:hypothetical protein